MTAHETTNTVRETHTRHDGPVMDRLTPDDAYRIDETNRDRIEAVADTLRDTETSTRTAQRVVAERSTATPSGPRSFGGGRPATFPKRVQRHPRLRVGDDGKATWAFSLPVT